MMKRLALLLAILLLAECAPSWKGVCRHEAVYCSLLAGEHVPVRIAVGYVLRGGNATRHAEAQGLINGRWQTLRADRGWTMPGDGLKKFYITEYVSPQQFIDEFFPVAGREYNGFSHDGRTHFKTGAQGLPSVDRGETTRKDISCQH